MIDPAGASPPVLGVPARPSAPGEAEFEAILLAAALKPLAQALGEIGDIVVGEVARAVAPSGESRRR